MSNAREVGKQAYAHFIGKGFIQVTNLLITIILARFLRADSYGLFSLGSTIMILFYTLFNLGVETAIVYYIPKSKNNPQLTKSIMNTAVLIRIITGIAGSILMYSLSDSIESIYKVSGLSQVCRIYSIGFFGYSIIYLSPSIFQAFKKFKLSAINDVVISLIKVIVILLTISGGLITVTIGFNVYLFISGIITLIIIYRKVAPKVKCHEFAFKKIIKYSLIIYAGAIAIFINNYVGALFVGGNPSDVSFITIGYKIGMLITLPAASLIAALFPNISELRDEKQIKLVYDKITRYALLISAILIFYTIICNNELINLILGESYNGSSLIINTLMIGFFLSVIAMPITTLFNGVKKPLIITSTLITQSIINLVITMFLTPSLHGFGAALSFLISSFVYMTILFIKSIKLKYYYNFKYLLRIIITVLITLNALWFNGLIIKTIMFLILFLTSGFLLKTIKKSDIVLIKQAITYTKKQSYIK